MQRCFCFVFYQNWQSFSAFLMFGSKHGNCSLGPHWRWQNFSWVFFVFLSTWCGDLWLMAQEVKLAKKFRLLQLSRRDAPFSPEMNWSRDPVGYLRGRVKVKNVKSVSLMTLSPSTSTSILLEKKKKQNGKRLSDFFIFYFFAVTFRA